jgi:hypothetical protein
MISSGPGQCRKCRVLLARGFARHSSLLTCSISAWLSFLPMVDTAPLDWMATRHSMHLSLTSFPHNSSDFNSNLINPQFSDAAPASLLPLPMASGLLLHLATWECRSKSPPSLCLCLCKFSSFTNSMHYNLIVQVRHCFCLYGSPRG